MFSLVLVAWLSDGLLSILSSSTSFASGVLLTFSNRFPLEGIMELSIHEGSEMELIDLSEELKKYFDFRIFTPHVRLIFPIVEYSEACVSVLLLTSDGTASNFETLSRTELHTMDSLSVGFTLSSAKSASISKEDSLEMLITSSSFL
ncbi:uncharacterized protein LOC113468009 [Diaphorina citri]|uniref:Uncharacterized protein LOC113468009 n=1 Tax=Diaphorina citri TaxID=121845 RepID=A0A3Q0IVX5_DIACI|nr:uncharacterized protein LOC113468009 [Diaphorina citri]